MKTSAYKIWKDAKEQNLSKEEFKELLKSEGIIVKKQLRHLEKGDSVWCGGDSGFAQDEIEQITDVSYLFDEKTGLKYKVIHLDNRRYDSRNGKALNPPLAYYIKTI